jgi:hypothetical protein
VLYQTDIHQLHFSACAILNRYSPIQNLNNSSIMLLTQVPLLGIPGYEMWALGTDISLHRVSVGQPGVGSSTRDFERWLKGALEVRRLSLYGSSVKGTWRAGSLTVYPGGEAEKAPETGT